VFTLFAKWRKMTPSGSDSQSCLLGPEEKPIISLGNRGLVGEERQQKAYLKPRKFQAHSMEQVGWRQVFVFSDNRQPQQMLGACFRELVEQRQKPGA
jgi:hypothetical protein